MLEEIRKKTNPSHQHTHHHIVLKNVKTRVASPHQMLSIIIV